MPDAENQSCHVSAYTRTALSLSPSSPLEAGVKKELRFLCNITCGKMERDSAVWASVSELWGGNVAHYFEPNADGIKWLLRIDHTENNS